MILGLISTFFGILSSILPSVMNFFSKRQDYKYELQLRQLEIEAAKQNIDLQTRIATIQQAAIEAKARYEQDAALNAPSAFINNLRVSVRPILTYIFFFMYMVAKGLLFYIAIINGAPLTTLVSVVMDDYSISIFGAIIGFWFGSRQIERLNYSSGLVLTESSDKSARKILPQVSKGINIKNNNPGDSTNGTTSKP